MTASADIEVGDEIRNVLGVKSPHESIDWLNLLIYGDPGVGKTTLAGTASDVVDTSPLLLIDIEGGVTTLRHKQTVDVVQVRSMAELERIVVALQNDLHAYYKTICLDSLTELQKLDMKAVMELEYNKNPDKVDKLVPTQRAWGKSGERVRLIVRALRDLPCHTIMTALATYDYEQRKDASPILRQISPSLPGKLKAEIPGFFDIVGYMQAVNERGEGNTTSIVRTIQFAKTEKVVAKDRTWALDDLMRNTTIPEMWGLITAPPSGSNGKTPTGEVDERAEKEKAKAKA